MNMNTPVTQPFITLKEFAARDQGLTLSGVRTLADDGVLPVFRFTKGGKRYVNMIRLMQIAGEHAERDAAQK